MAVFESMQALSSEYPWAATASVALILGTSVYLQSSHYKVCILRVGGSLTFTDHNPLQLRHIPTVGSSSWPLLSYFGARRYSTDALQYFQVTRSAN
jgi:hypothetical protein